MTPVKTTWKFESLTLVAADDRGAVRRREALGDGAKVEIRGSVKCWWWCWRSGSAASRRRYSVPTGLRSLNFQSR